MNEESGQSAMGVNGINESVDGRREPSRLILCSDIILQT